MTNQWSEFWRFFFSLQWNNLPSANRFFEDRQDSTPKSAAVFSGGIIMNQVMKHFGTMHELLPSKKKDQNWMMKLDYAKWCFKNVGSKVSKNKQPAYLAVSAINLYIAHEGDPWTLAAHTGRGSWSDVSTFCIARKDGSAIIEVPSEGKLVFLYAIFFSNGNRKMLCRSISLK